MESAPAAIHLWRAVTDRGRHYRSSTAQMADVMPRRVEAVAPIHPHCARKLANASATLSGRVLAAKVARARRRPLHCARVRGSHESIAISFRVLMHLGR